MELQAESNILTLLRENSVRMLLSDADKWFAAIDEYGKDHPDRRWMASDMLPYMGFVAYDPHDPDPRHVMHFLVTVGALRERLDRGDLRAQALKQALKNPTTRAEFALKIEDRFYKGPK